MEEHVSDPHDKLLLMPHGFETLSEEKQVEYLENLTEEDHARLAENHRVGSYLQLIGKYWELYDSMEEGQLVLDIDLSRILSDEEVAALSNYQYATVNERGWKDCEEWRFVYSYFTHHPYYETRCVYKRKCTEYLDYYPWIDRGTEYRSNRTCTSPPSGSDEVY